MVARSKEIVREIQAQAEQGILTTQERHNKVIDVFLWNLSFQG